MKKIIITAIKLLLALSIVVLLLSCIPKTIDINYPAVQYSQDDPTIVKNINITMKGKLYKPLFFNSKYVGTCIIEGYDFTKDYQLIDIKFKNRNSGLGILSYSTILTDGTPEIKQIGDIWLSQSINKLNIFGVAPKDIGINGSFESVIISAPANTLDEAKRITDEWRSKVKK